MLLHSRFVQFPDSFHISCFVFYCAFTSALLSTHVWLWAFSLPQVEPLKSEVPDALSSKSLKFFTTGSPASQLLNYLPFQHKVDTTDPMFTGHFSE